VKRHHAYRISRVDWRFVAWVLALALLVSWVVIGRLLVYIATGS
jgi:hypothetical protein